MSYALYDKSGCCRLQSDQVELKSADRRVLEAARTRLQSDQVELKCGVATRAYVGAASFNRTRWN